MQTLPRLALTARSKFEEVLYYVDKYLGEIVNVVNHNAQEIEIDWTMETPANGTYPVTTPHVARKVVGVGVVLQAGTCTVIISQGANTISWLAAGGTSLSVTTTDQTDTATTGNRFVAGTKITVAVSSVSGAAGLAVTLRTGS